MDPSSSGIWTRAIDAIKEWPLWLFVAVALSMTVLVAVPDFRGLASPTTGIALLYAAIVSWIFVLVLLSQKVAGYRFRESIT
jgi:hypothetical protein